MNEYPETLMLEVHGKPEGDIEYYLADSKSFIVVLRVDEHVAAIIDYGFMATFSSLRMMGCGLIRLLGVAREHQRKGYGRRLLDHALVVYRYVKTPNVYEKVAQHALCMILLASAYARMSHVRGGVSANKPFYLSCPCLVVAPRLC